MISPDDTEKSVYAALKGGYRMIDTANAYMNEEAVGKALARAIREGIVKRGDVFVSTKIWPTVYEDEDAVDKTLKRLGLDFVDLLFIHQPSGNFMAGYRLIEKAYKEGKTRSLGISNTWNEKLEKLLEAAEIKPHVIQLEAHPYCTEKEIMGRLAEYGARLMGWYPLGHGDPGLVQEKIFSELADKYHVNPSFVPNSLQPHGLYPARFLCPWDSPGKNTGVGCHVLLQGVFPTQGSNLCLLHLQHWQALRGSVGADQLAERCNSRG